MYAYCRTGPGRLGGCFRRFLTEENAFVFWWRGATVDDWRGNCENLMEAIRPHQANPALDQAASLWNAIHHGQFVGFTVLPTQFCWFHFQQGQVSPATPEMRVAWAEEYRNGEVRPGQELVYATVECQHLPLPSIPNFLVSLPCNRRVGNATFLNLTEERYREHLRVLGVLLEGHPPIVVETPRERLLYLGPQQLETAVVLALIQKGVTGIALRPHNLATWDIIGRIKPLPDPLPGEAGIYLQVKRILTGEARQDWLTARLWDGLENGTGFLICPRVQNDEENHILGGNWLAGLIAESDFATRYVEGCIGRWVTCQA